MALAEGSVLGGYRVVRLIGRGGMGAVYLADDIRLGRNVALKVLSSETAEIPAVRERFVRESQLAASLDHPHILPIYEAGEADGQLFIAMRYVPGPDLEGLITRDGPLPLERTVALIGQIASALDVAHGAGLIHRDVKPGNILVAAGSGRGTDHAYLTDFGLTKQAEYGAGLTRSGQLLGSVGYVAPELIESRPIDARVDVYSLGCVLYECLAGAQPYPRDTEMATLYAHVQAPPPSLAESRPELPATIDGVIAKAMAKTPEARYQSAGELARALTDASTPEAAGRHLTRGFLFADLRGYTAYVEGHGDEAAAALLETYRRLVRDVVRRFGGAEIKTEGDSFYVVFPSASEAVRCGLALTAAAATATSQAPGRPIAVGVGIHAGETAETAEGYVGSAVNLAARICAQAAAGEVLVSDTVRGLARTSSEVTFAARGRRRLKGIAEPIAVFAATAAATGTAVGGPPPRRPSTTRLGAFGDRAGRRALAGAAVVAAVALVAVLVASAIGGGFRASPAPSLGTRASLPLAQVPQSAVASPASYGVIAFVQTPNLFGQATDCLFLRSAGQGNVLIMRDDGSDLAPLTSDLMGGDVSPAVSPDGTSVAYLGSGFRFRDVSLSGASGTELSVPASGQGFGGPPPSWSPDGRQLAYIDFLSDGTEAAFIANADGSVPQLLWKPPPPAKATTSIRLVATGPTPGPKAASVERLASLDWMHDGRIALLISTESLDSSGTDVGYVGSQLDAITADGRTLSTLATGLGVAGPFDVSPDGSRIVISGSAGANPTEQDGSSPPAIYVMNANGSNLVQLTHDSGPDEDPVWSPDGSKIAFSSWQANGAQIDVLPSQGGRPQALTQPGPNVADCQPSWRLSSGPLPSPARIAKGDASDPLRLGPGDLKPGVYASTPFKPTFQLDLPAGWEGVNLSTDGLYLWRTAATRERLWVSQVQVVFAGECISSPTKIIGPTALDFVNWIKTDEDLQVGTVYPTSVGGVSGLSFEVSVRHVPGRDHCQPVGNKTALYPISNDQVALQIDDLANFLALDVNGTRVVLTLFGTKADLDADSANVTALLASIRFP